MRIATAEDAARLSNEDLIEKWRSLCFGEYEFVRLELLKRMAPDAELVRVLRALKPTFWSGGFGQVCNGCHMNTFELGQHSEDCPVAEAERILKERG